VLPCCLILPAGGMPDCCAALLQATGIAEGSVGTIATVIGGILGIGVLAYLANSI
jgi:hypothetical protein